MSGRDFDPENLLSPGEPHFHAFTWENCFAQVERESRVYRFGIVGEEEDRHFRIYGRRRGWSGNAWLAHDMNRRESQELMNALEHVRLPLYFDAPRHTSAHLNNRLTIPRQGTSLEIWWDSIGNPVLDAMEPVLPYLFTTREAMKDAFAAKDKSLSVEDSDL